MPIIGWVDTEDVIDEWADAPDGELLASYLDAAYEQCVEYLPPETDLDPETVPARWPKAQLMQARALYRAVAAGSGDQIGADGMTVTVFPMDWTVRNLLRPRRIGRVL